MTRAVNYARHNQGHYVFLARGERPDRTWLTADWAWWKQPVGEFTREIGETGEMTCMRIEHALQTCNACRRERSKGGAR